MKKQPIISSLVFVIVAAFIYIACQKKYSFDIPDISNANPITASLTGRVTDDSHLPVKNARVTTGSATTTTDINGYFRFKNITIGNPDISYVKVEKDGFFMGSRTYQSYPGSNDYVSIQLIKKVAAGNFTGNTGGTVTIPNGGKIEFPINALINSITNSPYTGTVTAAAYFIDPSASDFQEMMPGTLRGIDADNKQAGLQSFGMMAVELTGTGNEKLQLAAGKSATLTFPIPTGLQSQSPVTIPLWSFDEKTGLWKQDGNATRQGNNYVGTVNHFSFWNCDFPLPIIKFSGTYVNQNGIPLSHVKVLVKTVDDAITTFGYGYTDSAGKITGTLPAQKALLATVFNKCGDPVDIRHIGPFISDVNIGTLTVKVNAATMVRFTGTVVNCTGATVSNGFVDVFIENNHYFGTVSNGNFNMTVGRCSANSTTATISAYDDANISQVTSTQFTVADTLVATGQLTACGVALGEFLNLKLNGVPDIYVSPADTILLVKNQNGVYSAWIGRTQGASSNEIHLVFPSTTTTTTPLTSLIIQNNNISYSLKSPSTINITENGAVGGYISGNFTADVKKDSTTITYQVLANFRFKRFN